MVLLNITQTESNTEITKSNQTNFINKRTVSMFKTKKSKTETELSRKLNVRPRSQYDFIVSVSVL